MPSIGAIFCMVFMSWAFYRFFMKLRSPLRKMPGPFTWSPLGQILNILEQEPAEPFIKWSEQYGKIFCYQHFLNADRVAILDVDAIKHVLVTNSHKYCKPPFILRLIKPLFGDGLTTAEGRMHAEQRKLLNPAFKYSNLRVLVPTLRHYGEILTELWVNEMKDGSVTELDVLKDLNRVTLDITCKCIFDYECNSLLTDGNEISEAFRALVSGSDVSLMSIIPILKNLPTAKNRSFAKSLKLSHQAIDGVIESKIRDKQEGDSDGQQNSILDILLSLEDDTPNNSFTKQHLHDQVITFIFAGQETTSVSMTWTLYALSRNLDVQQRARDEVQMVLRRHNTITWDVLDELSYLECVIKESLRLYPPAPLTFRVAMTDDKIGIYDIPKGTSITIVLPHRLPEYFSNPLEFNPDRWRNPNHIKRYSFIPFLAGPRTCIGHKFALAEMKVVLALLLNKLSFAPVPGREISRKSKITMRPHPDLILQVSKI